MGAKVSRHASRFRRLGPRHRQINEFLAVVFREIADQDARPPDLILEDPIVDDDPDTEEVGPEEFGEGVRILKVAVSGANHPGETPVRVVEQILHMREEVLRAYRPCTIVVIQVDQAVFLHHFPEVITLQVGDIMQHLDNNTGVLRVYTRLVLTLGRLP